MSAEENIEATKRGYAAFASGDAEGALALLDDQVEWIIPGNSTISGTYRGKEEVAGFWMKIAEKSFATSPQHFLGDDERVVVLTEVTIAGEEPSDQADVLTFRDGKVVKFQSAADTARNERIWGTK